MSPGLSNSFTRLFVVVVVVFVVVVFVEISNNKFSKNTEML